ncbi:MAG: hypothetical protein A2X34_07260 [Elusimicrobia bacterium GWC2_51_8]|nr:MAG: hypothetical protein A2X33_05655 [Elusimicrobia bacterium GWA2_51_34]OGR64034.1 MAG: hypothetical protein A2X34_07260 [Elusimicrobia bacterium GWC2_51_8]HAF94976.1 hypothetical protein [Elusimicrobiota bacterium]HCE99114.1 hypothetical protein [Elusimicrobiota bacterium]
MKNILPVILLLGLPVRAAAGDAAFTLASVESSALASSKVFKSARDEAEAAAASAKSARSALYPKVLLEGQLKYLEVVPFIAMPAALGGHRPMGDNWNYSAGPAAYWTIFDYGAVKKYYESLRHTAQSKAVGAEHARRRVLFEARTAYFRLRLALEKVYLIGDNLQLALAQLKDISFSVKAGSRSRLDELMASQEVLARRRDLLKARNDISDALRDLSFITGAAQDPRPQAPLDARMKDKNYGVIEPAGDYITADTLESLLSKFAAYSASGPDPAGPSIKAFEELAAAYRSASAGAGAERGPKLQISAKSSLDYPNGPNLYSFNQNTAGLSLSLPLFEGGKSSLKARESSLAADAALERSVEARNIVERDFYKARDAFMRLDVQQKINIEAVDRAGEAAELAYGAYKAGGATYLEVENANLRVLSAKTTVASATAEMLYQLAVMASLAKEGYRP